MWPLILIAVYCLLVATASLAGGVLPSKMRLTHTRMQTVMSFVGGMVLGVGLLHLLPHSIAETGSVDMSVGAALAGLLTMFLLIRIFHVHQHGPIDPSDTVAHEHHVHEHLDHGGHEHRDREDCSRPPEYPVAGELCATHRHTYSWIGLAIGLALHTLIDGVALAASVTAELKHTSGSWQLLGLGTFLAILLHKPLDAMSITSVMHAGGWSARAQGLVNLVFATTCGVGAAAFYLGIQQYEQQEHLLVGVALGFAAGVFLCISLADILPEVQFHAHDRVKLTTALLLGVLLAYGIGFIEPDHQHGHAPGGSSPAREAHGDHDHSGHDHGPHSVP